MTATATTIGGRYRLVARLGRGGMATVWAAEDRVLGRRVAVKLFDLAAGDRRHDDPEATVDATDVDARRAAAEMHTLAALSHPALVTVFDAGTDAGRPYLVLELVDDKTRKTLQAALDNPHAPSTKISVALGELGHRTSSHVVQRHRRGECRCAGS